MSLPAVLVVSSHVVRGSVGARAAFVLERLGHRVWSLPTVILPWHPGHGRAHRVPLPAADFEALGADLARAPWLGEIGAVVSGYLGDPAQADTVARLVAAVRERNPRALYVCDPILGDDGGLYVREEVAIAQRDVLLPIADVATPNRFELSWLAGLPAETLGEVATAARGLAPPTVVVTSAPAMMRGKIATALVTATDMVVAETQRIEGAPSGTGDLFGALLVSRLLEGRPGEQALAAAAAGTVDLIARSVKAGSDELDLTVNQDSLVRPLSLVDLRRWAPPARPRAPKAGPAP
ncbi:pyridoxal kinase [Chthonobacter rhizosphaerae]|uniref:pyridoxal kinase n=1 Tax=Chthonobacter rhizosphaerae TaxID=2735553 RepID=UPI0015EF7C36|nr:pyridoxal kinase [Chthonobacter rhizosphaerae]